MFVMLCHITQSMLGFLGLVISNESCYDLIVMTGRHCCVLNGFSHTRRGKIKFTVYSRLW